jgi:hypothetical protein
MEAIVNKKTLMYVAVFIAGVVLAGKVRQLPLLDKLPSF